MSLLDASGGHSCVLCNASLPSKEALQLHFREHANGRIRTDTGSRLSRRPASGGRPPASTRSAKSAADGSVSKPSAGVDGELWECDVCAEKYKSVSAAITHKFRSHPGSAGKHYCPHCGQQFPLRMSYERHVRSHPTCADPSAEPHLSCDECEARFFREQALSFHVRSVHSRSKYISQPKFCPPPSMKIDVSQSGEMRSCYYCHLCGCEYTIKFNLQRHLSRMVSCAVDADAPPAGLIRCQTCQAVFFNERAYTAHLLRHGPEDLYVSSEEQRLLVVDRVDLDLDLSRVPSVLDRYVPDDGPIGRRPQSSAKRRGRQTAAAVPPQQLSNTSVEAAEEASCSSVGQLNEEKSDGRSSLVVAARRRAAKRSRVSR